MKIRPKLNVSPLGYTLYRVDGSADPLNGFSKTLWAENREVSLRLKELVFMRCSIINHCDTCLAAHVKTATERGVTGEEIEALSNPGDWAELFNEHEKAALQLCEVLCDQSHEVPEELRSELRSLFSEVELAEIILVIGQANLNNRSGNAAKQLLGR